MPSPKTARSHEVAYGSYRYTGLQLELRGNYDSTAVAPKARALKESF
jgi:hypothetical protein